MSLFKVGAQSNFNAISFNLCEAYLVIPVEEV